MPQWRTTAIPRTPDYELIGMLIGLTVDVQTAVFVAMFIRWCRHKYCRHGSLATSSTENTSSCSSALTPIRTSARRPSLWLSACVSRAEVELYERHVARLTFSHPVRHLAASIKTGIPVGLPLIHPGPRTQKSGKPNANSLAVPDSNRAWTLQHRPVTQL